MPAAPFSSLPATWGGTGDEGGLGVASDASGNAYVTGFTTSKDFPTTKGHPLQKTYGRGDSDVFVAKIDSTGLALLYSTYLGGSAGDEGNGIAVDSLGSAYLAGFTSSTDFPTANAVQPLFGGGLGSCFRSVCGDAFVAKLDPMGSFLFYSTYLGGHLADEATAIAIDGIGNAYVAGFTSSHGTFPLVNPLQQSANFDDAFIAKIVDGN